MAAKTPASVSQESLGSVRLVRAVFTDVDNTDTWASAITGVIDGWFSPSTTTGSTGVSVSGSTVTFACSADNQAGTLYLLCRS